MTLRRLGRAIAYLLSACGLTSHRRTASRRSTSLVEARRVTPGVVSGVGVNTTCKFGGQMK
jgi:hypothetical protein